MRLSKINSSRYGRIFQRFSWMKKWDRDLLDLFTNGKNYSNAKFALGFWFYASEMT